MAIYHFEGKIISRSTGRSAIAASAYRACEKLQDQRTGLIHDFTKKSPDLVNSTILLPTHAPKEFQNREVLWNTVEAVEKRKDAQLARDFNIALPRELSEAQNWELAKAFVQKEFVDRGMIADLSYHRGHKSQEGQPHIHVMLTLREVTEKGFGQKVRIWNDKALLLHLREAWANECNRELAKQGIDMRIDHRTLEAQGIDLEPQTKIGAKAAWDHAAKMEEHIDKARANGERIIENPYIVLDAISKQQSTFTRQDIARTVNRYTANAEQFNEAFAKALAHKDLIQLGVDDFNQERYTTREMLMIEKHLVTQAMDLSKQNDHRVDPQVSADIAKRAGLEGQQLSAFEYLVSDGDAKNLVGVAGSGKSRLLDAVREAHEAMGQRVIGMTLAGKAAEGLQESSGIESRTVASYINAWDNGFETIERKDVIVIDEAAMLDSRQFDRIVTEAHKHGAKIIAAFDTEQLQAIGAGAPARAIAERTGFVELSVVRRQQVEWQREASQHFAMGETQKGLLLYEKHDCVHAYNTKDDAIQGILERWEELRSSAPDKTQLMLAYENKDVQKLNEAARELRKEAGELEHGHIIQTASKGKLEFAAGDRIYFLRNDYHGMDVRNGTLGTIERIDGDIISVKVDATERKPERIVTVDTTQYNHLDYGYAATVHKSQGATVDYTQYLPSPYADRHASYSAMTRHRLNADIHYSRESFTSFEEAAHKMSRENTKDFTLDYIEVRGLEAREEFKIKREVAYTQEEQHDITVGLRQAAVRLNQQAFDRDLERAGRNLGMTLSADIKAGDKGIYRGVVEIDGKRYGVLDQGKGQGKIIERDFIIEKNPKHGRVIEVEKFLGWEGQEQLRGVHQSKDNERSLEKGKSQHDRDIDFL